jgi:hypothetical protein
MAPHSRRVRRAGWVLPFAFAAAAANAATVEVHSGLDPGARADLVVQVRGEIRCTIRIAGAAAELRGAPACRFELPASAASLDLRGTYAPANAGRMPVERSWRLVDLAGVAGLLSQPDLSYGERMAAFIPAANAFAARQLGEAHAGAVEAGTPASQAEIEAAEKRLGYALPADFVSMQRRVGALALGDHYLTPIGSVNDADTQMRTLWGTPEEAMRESYSEARRTALRASTLLFTEAGDGFGGLRYRPAPTKACGSRDLYEWVSQEGGDRVLRNADGSCMDFAAAFRWVLEGLLFADWSDALGGEQALLVDSSAAVQRMKLGEAPGEPGIGLEAAWRGPHEPAP